MLSPSFTTKPKRGVTKNNLNFCEIKASLTWNIQRQNREEGDAGRREMKCRCIHFQGFRNKSQTRGLKTTEIIILPQFRRLDTWNQGVGKVSSFWKESLSPFSLLSSGGRRALGILNLQCITLISDSTYTWPFSCVPLLLAFSWGHQSFS